MVKLAIWAHSVCRSTFGLYRELAKLVPVEISVWGGGGVEEMRASQGFDVNEFNDLSWTRVGEDRVKARQMLEKTQGYAHLVSAYQVSENMRRVVGCAKGRGDWAGVFSEAPWNAQCGLKRLAWNVYLRGVVRRRVRKVTEGADLFVNLSGDKDGLAQAIGWRKDRIFPFGYYPLPLENCRRATGGFSGRKVRMLATATRGRLRRGERIVEKAVSGLGENVELIMPGMISLGEVKQLYSTCDIFIAAGEDEPWGIRVNDALNAGLPVVVSDGMGAGKLVGETGAGLLFKRGNASDLRLRLREVMDSYQGFEDAAQNAHGKISPAAKAQVLLSKIMKESGCL